MNVRTEAQRLLRLARARGLGKPTLKADEGPARVSWDGEFRAVWLGDPEAVRVTEIREARDRFLVALAGDRGEEAGAEACRREDGLIPHVREERIEPGRREYLALIAPDRKRAARRLSAGLWPPVPARGVYHDPSADGGFTDPFWKTRRDRPFHSSCSPTRREEAERARRERTELAAEGLPVPSDRLPEADQELARWP